MLTTTVCCVAHQPLHTCSGLHSQAESKESQSICKTISRMRSVIIYKKELLFGQAYQTTQHLLGYTCNIILSISSMPLSVLFLLLGCCEAYINDNDNGCWLQTCRQHKISSEFTSFSGAFRCCTQSYHRRVVKFAKNSGAFWEPYRVF